MIDKDCADEGNVSKELLEEIIMNEAHKETMQAYALKEPIKYFEQLAYAEASKYKRPWEIKLHLYNFLVDSYTYWRRHNHHTNAHECERSEAQWLAMRDAFEYMGRLNNGFPMQYRKMISNWRTGDIIRKNRRKK